MLTMTSMLTKIHRKTVLSTAAAYQFGLNCIREICIFMYKIASVGRGAHTSA